jgi:hypothetical protein
VTLRLTWYGDKVRAKVRLAEMAGLEETAELAIAHARSNHPSWRTQSGAAERSYDASRVVQELGRARIVVGSFGIPYGRKLEGRDNTLHRAVTSAGTGLWSRIARRLR